MRFAIAWAAVIILGAVTRASSHERGPVTEQTGAVLRVPHRGSRMLYLLSSLTCVALAFAMFVPPTDQTSVSVDAALGLVLVALVVRTARLSIRVEDTAFVVRRGMSTVKMSRAQVRYLDVTNYSVQDWPVLPGMRLFAVGENGKSKTFVLDLTRGYRHCPHLAQLLADVSHAIPTHTVSPAAPPTEE